MTETNELLRGELERLFELHEMTELSSELMGYDPEAVGGMSGKGAFARALVDAAQADSALMALADAIQLYGKKSSEVPRVFDVRIGRDLDSGEELGGFKVVKKLADGGLGKVYLAERVEDGVKTRVAIKVIRSSLSADRSAVARYLTSQRAFRRAGVAGVAEVHGCGTLDDGRPWVATAFIEGQTLAARIERVGPMHFNEARPIFAGLLEALQGAHDRGLVHGDMKSSNVFTTRPEKEDGTRGEPTGVIVDGGAFKLLAGGAKTPDAIGALRVFGSAEAIAPEMARGAAMGPGADVYAVGVMLYECLTGQVPFSGASAFEVIAKHLEHTPDAPSGVAPKGWVAKELDGILTKALAKDPAARYGSAKDLADALESFAKSKEKKEKLDEKAFAKAKKALVDKPGDGDAATKVEEIASPARAWTEAIDAFQKALEKAKKDADKKALLFRIARLQSAELGDPVAAATTYDAIREIDPDDAIAQSGLEELRRRAGDYDALAELLLERAEKVEESVARAGVLREIAEIYEERLEDEENALVAWTQALADEPADEKTQRAIERIAAKDGDRWNEVLTTLNEAVQETESAGDGAQLYTLMGRWYADELRRPDFALPCYSQALQLDPSFDAAYEGTVALYEKAQSWQELAQLLAARADATENPAAARDYRAQAADIVLRKVGDQDRAVAMLQEVLRDDAAHPKALDAMASIHEARGEWAELATLLVERVKQAGGADKVRSHLKLAELYEDRQNDFEKASVQYEAASALDPQSVEALKGLERLYARTNNYPELLNVLRRQLDVLATPRQKIGVLEHIGAIQEEEFVDHDAAIEAYEEVVKIDSANEGANAALARLYRQVARFDELVTTLERHAGSSTDESRKIDLMLTAVRTLMVDVGAPERAVEICDRVLALDPKNVEALGLQARLKAQSGDATAAVSAVDQLAANESDPKVKAAHYVEAAKLLEEAGDKDRAIERFKKALDADKQNTVAADALRRLYAARGDASGAAELLKGELERTESDLRKSELLAELGQLYAERLDDAKRARESFDRSLELDSSNTNATRGLGDLAFAAGDHAGAAAIYEPLLSRTGDMTPEVAKTISLRTGEAFAAARKFMKAQRAYLNAKAYAPNDREVLERLAEVTFEAGEADEAAELYRDVLEKFGGEISASEKGRMLFRRGDSLLRSGDTKGARPLLEEAAELRPEDAGPLTALADVHAADGRWDDVVSTLRRRMESADDTERFSLLVRVGDVQQDKLSDRQKAAKSYVAALEIVPDDRNLLTKLMGVYSESKDWSRLVEVILRIAELVNDPRQLSKYYLTAASIANRELGRSDEAADYYESALEHDPKLTKAFEGLVMALTASERWSDLVNAYAAQIARTKDAPGEEHAALYDALGDVHREKREDSAAATEAYEKAQKLDPDGRRRLELLAEIYAESPKRFYKKAVGVHAELLRRNPYRVESYQSLRQLYTDVKRPDEAWCICQTLKVLGMAGPDEEAFFKKHRSRHPAAAQDFFGEDVWFNQLIHRDQGPLLTEIFAELAPAVLAANEKNLSEYQVAGERDASSDDSPMVQTLGYVAGVTKITLPTIYSRPDDPGGLSTLFVDPLAVGVGQGALAGGPPQALAFVAARHLTYFRPGLSMRQIVPSAGGLRTWVLAAIQLVNPAFPAPPKIAAKVAKRLELLKNHASKAQKDKLRTLVPKLLASSPELDMKKWIAAVDLTADRVGFVMANDLELAAAVIKASPEDSMPHKERLKELYLFSASRQYTELRDMIGIAIEG